MKDRICKNCKWFDAKGDVGYCRKNTPIVTEIFGHWPMVRVDDWCGEYDETWTPGELNDDK